MDTEIPKYKIFDWLHSVNVSKTYLMQDNHPDLVKQYDPFMFNRWLAQNIDTVGIADILNGMHHLPRDIQYRYALAGISRKKRYAKWAKKSETNPDVMTLAKFYKVNVAVAELYIKLMTPEQLEETLERASGGGVRK